MPSAAQTIRERTQLFAQVKQKYPTSESRSQLKKQLGKSWNHATNAQLRELLGTKATKPESKPATVQQDFSAKKKSSGQFGSLKKSVQEAIAAHKKQNPKATKEELLKVAKGAAAKSLQGGTKKEKQQGEKAFNQAKEELEAKQEKRKKGAEAALKGAKKIDQSDNSDLFGGEEKPDLSHQGLSKAGAKFSEKYLSKLAKPSKKEEELLQSKKDLGNEILRHIKTGQAVPIELTDKATKADFKYQKVLGRREHENSLVYRELLDGLIKHHGVSDKQVNEAIESINVMPLAHTARIELAEKHPGGNIDEAYKKKIESTKSDISSLYRMAGMKGANSLEEIGYTDARAYANRAGFINVGDGDRVTIFHEVGHHIEYESPEILEAAKAWMKTRATSSTPQKLNDITKSKEYDDDEVALPGKFIKPYVGKVYSNATEVTSVGIENFSSIPKMVGFHEQDPEHFNLTLGILLHKNANKTKSPAR